MSSPGLVRSTARAIELGAKSISAPEDKPYNERQAGFVDAGGNTWWVSRYLGAGS
jgi:PhnB protein